MIRTLQILCILALVYHTGYSQRIDTNRLNAYFDTLARHDKFMGSVAIMRHGKVVYTKTTGYISIPRKVKAMESAKYHIGSISKLYTATLVLKAVEKGWIRLDDTLSQYFPIIPNAKKITIQNLLQHRSGISDIITDTGYYRFYTKLISEDTMISKISQLPVSFEPDYKSNYSNSNYILLSYILQKVYKKPYATILAQEITIPLKLTNTKVSAFSANVALKECKSYRYREEWIELPETDMSVVMGAGNITTKSRDLLVFTNALFSGQIISKKSLEQMKTFHGEFGLGIAKIPYNEKMGLGHTGGIDGFGSIVAYFEEDGLGVAVLTNGVNYDFQAITMAVMDAAYGKAIEMPTINYFKSSPSELDVYVGGYENTRVGMLVYAFRENNTLYIQAMNQEAFPVEAVSKGVFKFELAGLEFRFFPEKNQLILRQGGRDIEFVKSKKQ